MAKSANQKTKILYITKMLLETDESHLLTMSQILDTLREHEIPAERKSIYDDLESLREFGFEIESHRGRYSGYYLKSSPFGTRTNLSAAAESRTSGTDEKATEKTAVLPASETAETSSEKADETVEAPAKKPVMPVWFSGATQILLSCDEKAYKKISEMPEDTFQTAENPEKKKGKHKVYLSAEPSPEFYGWLTGLGTGARIIAPTSVIKSYRKYLKEIRALYKED